MVGSTRVNLHLPPEIAAIMDRLAEERGLTRTSLVRQALGVMQVCHDAGKDGLLVGTCRNREHLETVIASPL